MNLIGLNQEKTAEISKELNKLLATYQVFYMNVRGFHWNIKGQQFFELHTKFEEIYNDLLTKVDEIAERILTLGEQPLHAYSQYAKTLRKLV
ncbi:DNA starvation/stationary phase protection protein, partial [Piscirickettsiaceae bacterium NZ-RLO2]